MAQKNATLRALIEGVLYDLMPKGSVYNIWVDDTTTLAAKLAEVITSLNGKVTPEQLTTAIEEALSGFEGGGGDSPIKPFPVTTVGDKKYVYVTELEDKTFYCLDPSSCDNYVQFSDKNIWEDALRLYVDKNHIYLHEISGQSSGVLHGKNIRLNYMLNLHNKVIIAPDNSSLEYLETSNVYSYTPRSNYHPATKKYVDDTVSEKISGIVFPEIPEIPEPVQGNWNQNDPTADDYIKNRTHWVEVNGTNTLEWDGNTDGLASFSPDGSMMLYKVTDSFIGKSDLVGGTATLSGSMDIAITEEMIMGEVGDGLELYTVVVNESPVILTVNQDADLGGITIEKGTYFLSMGVAGYVSKLTVLNPVIGGAEIVHKIDPKFLPEGGFGYDDSKELLPESTHTFTEEMDFMSPLSSALGLKVGESYTVNWNGTEYSCECVTFEMDGIPCPAIGDTNLFITGEPSGDYPFLIFDIPAEFAAQIGIYAAVTGLDGSASATVKVIKESIHTIDPKFLPGNKSPLTFTGAVEGAYDGSEALTINIPSTDEVVQAVLYSLGESKVLGTVDENNVITVTSSLGDGTYILKYENADGTTTEIGQIVIGSGGSSYVNLADTASSDWLTNKRINSSKNIVDVTESQRGDDTVVVTNFIDIVGVKKLHIKGLDVLSALSSGQNYGRFYVYDSNKTIIVASAQPSTTSYVTVADYDSSVWIIDCEAYLGEWGFADERYVRLGGILTGSAADVVITADDNIQ